MSAWDGISNFLKGFSEDVISSSYKSQREKEKDALISSIISEGRNISPFNKEEKEASSAMISLGFDIVKHLNETLDIEIPNELEEKICCMLMDLGRAEKYFSLTVMEKGQLEHLNADQLEDILNVYKYRKYQLEKGTLLDEVGKDIFRMMLEFFKRVPVNYLGDNSMNDEVIKVDLFDQISDLSGFIAYIQTFLYDRQKQNHYIFDGWAGEIQNKHILDANEVAVQEVAEKENRELIDLYLRGTSLHEFFFRLKTPFNLPLKIRFEHTHIVSGTGHGKTQLMLLMIYQDILRAQENKGGFCVIDSQNDFIKTILELSEFDPMVKNSLSDKLIIVDPSDINFPISLNMFDIDFEKMKGDEIHQAMMKSATLALYEYIFSDLIKGELTLYMQNLYRNCSELLFKIPGSNIMTLLDLLEDGDKFREYFPLLDGMAKRFFEKEFFEKKYDSQKAQIAARLFNILSDPTFSNMFTAKNKSIDMFQAMQEGKIVLINTAKLLLQEDRATMLGKFFLAMILQATYQRAIVPEKYRKPFFVYIDESQDYFSMKIAEFLSQARKYKVGIIFAHQNLQQLKEVSTGLFASVESNTSIKISGSLLSQKDAKSTAQLLRCTEDDIFNLQRKDGSFSEFMCYVKGAPKAIKITVPLGVVNKKDKMSDQSFRTLISNNRKKYAYSKVGENDGCTHHEGHENLSNIPDEENHRPQLPDL